MMMLHNFTKRRIVWTVVVVAIMLVPLSMLFTNEVQWTEAVAYGVILLAVGGAFELWQWLKKRTLVYRFAFGAGLTGILLLGWVNGAVGLIGSEDNPANLLYWIVFFVWLGGSFISHFKPRGMAVTLLTVAVVQLLVPVFALLVWPARTSWGEAGVTVVFIFNSVFAVLFAVSAVLFRRAAVAEKK